MEINEMLNSDDIEIFNLGIELKKQNIDVTIFELMKYYENAYQRITYKLSQQLLKDIEKIKNKNNV